MKLSIKNIQQALARIPCPDTKSAVSKNLHPAAVLIPIFQKNSTWHLLFIKRAHHKADRHSGQIAFPGGRSEPADSSLLETALRETKEEIGLPPQDVKILGQSCALDTVTDYHVTPFVGMIPWPYSFRLSPLEVDSIIPISLPWLRNPEHYQIKKWTPNPEKYTPKEVIFYQRIEGELLWGATARMVLDFIHLLTFIEERKRN